MTSYISRNSINSPSPDLKTLAVFHKEILHINFKDSNGQSCGPMHTFTGKQTCTHTHVIPISPARVWLAPRFGVSFGKRGIIMLTLRRSCTVQYGVVKQE